MQCLSKVFVTDILDVSLVKKTEIFDQTMHLNYITTTFKYTFRYIFE